MRGHFLDQTESWKSADGEIRLVDMDATHKVNVLEMLRRRADYQRRMYYLRLERSLMSCPDDGVFAELEHEKELALDQSAQRWLEAKPFMIELSRLVRIDESVDGEVVDATIVNEITAGPRQLEG